MLIHQFRPITGGAELQAERLSGKLINLGHSVEVLTRLWDDSAPEEIINAVKVIRVSFPYAYTGEGKQAVETFRYLFNNRHKYDIFHAHQGFGHAMVAVVVARCFGKRSIVKIACAGEYGDLNVLSNLEGGNKALSILRKADAIIAISREVEMELIENGFVPGQIHLIPNGVDTDFFKRTIAIPTRERFRFILIGRRHPQKGIDTAFQALKQLKEEGLAGSVELRLYGRDYEGHDYRQIAFDLGVGDMVEFLPFSDTIFDVYQDANGFILPSRGEGLSNSLLESMSMELPVIATRVSGTEDVIENGQDGILVSPDSPEELAQAMQRLIINHPEAIKLGRNARVKVCRKFSLDYVAQKYSELYNELCS